MDAVRLPPTVQRVELLQKMAPMPWNTILIPFLYLKEEKICLYLWVSTHVLLCVQLLFVVMDGRTWVFRCMCLCVCGSQNQLWVYLQEHHSPLLRKGLLVARLAGHCSRNITVFAAVTLGLQTYTTMLGFRHVLWGTNSGPYVYKANVLSTDPDL